MLFQRFLRIPALTAARLAQSSARQVRCCSASPAELQGTRAAALIIGDEILSGKVQDLNVHHLASALYRRGVDLVRVEVVSDQLEDIAASVLGLKERVGEGGVVFTAGGIGATHDDRTYEAIAQAFGVGLEVHEETLRRMTAHYEARGLEVNSARRRMATLPQDCEVGSPIEEVLFTPGLWVPLVNLRGVHVLPGIPRLFAAMLDAHVGRFRGPAFHSATLYTRQGEGTFADALRGVAEAHPGVSIGSYPIVSPTATAPDAAQAAWTTKLVVSGRDRGLVEAALEGIQGVISDATDASPSLE